MIKVKKVLSLLFALLFAICSLSIVSFASDNENITKLLESHNVKWQTKGEKCVNLSDGISYNLEYYISDELLDDNISDNNFKYKKVVLAGSFYDEEKNKLNLDNCLEVKFKYDGNMAMIEDPEKDITHTPKVNETKKLKVIEKTDIYVSPNQCILSNQTDVHKKRKWYDFRKTWDNLDNFHTDIVCLNNGEIKINFESLSELPGQDFYINPVSSEIGLLKHNVTRKVNVSDKIYKQNDDSQDKYEYKTRLIEIEYLNKDNKLCLKLEIEANFRFNKATHEVECVSTSHRETDSDDEWEVYSVFLRSGDETKNKGGAYGVIGLENSINAICEDYEENISVKCDKNGDITSDVILKK